MCRPVIPLCDLAPPGTLLPPRASRTAVCVQLYVLFPGLMKPPRWLRKSFTQVKGAYVEVRNGQGAWACIFSLEAKSSPISLRDAIRQELGKYWTSSLAWPFSCHSARAMPA